MVRPAPPAVPGRGLASLAERSFATFGRDCFGVELAMSESSLLPLETAQSHIPIPTNPAETHLLHLLHRLFRVSPQPGLAYLPPSPGSLELRAARAPEAAGPSSTAQPPPSTCQQKNLYLYIYIYIYTV